MLPSGFRISGIRCGIKEKGRDLGLILSFAPSVSSCMITKNRLKAPSVVLTKENVEKGKIQAIIANSGNANCAVSTSYKDTYKIMSCLSKELKIKQSYIGIAQTGVIGRKLPVEKILKNIPSLVKKLNTNTSPFLEAILTTDKTKKEISRNVVIGDKIVTVWGSAKGSGMIAPNLATMLCFILTDAHITKDMLDEVLKYSVSNSFNLITVDGCTSTNDLVIALANGKAENKLIEKNDKSYRIFQDAFYSVCLYLAKEIVKDGEGATKIIKVNVINGPTHRFVEKIAKSIANSNLVKTAMFGGDPNWGRILSAIGASGVDVDINKIDIYFDNIKVCENGFATCFNEKKAREILKKDEFEIVIDLKTGKNSVIVYTCDLSYDYVKINAEYHT